MDTVVRSLAIYLFLLVLFRLTGKRSLAQITTFDFVLLLIISEAIQQGLLGNDYSMINAILAATTMVTLDVFLSIFKQRSRRFEQVLEGSPMVILENGRPLKDRMEKERVDESDILETARQSHGIERIEQIKFAVLERSGDISIIPKETP
jgi:uncharacterized membrane protein YcaP (DUF421 family)